MTVTIGRRELLVALGAAAAVWPLVARAQQRAKLSTIGLLGAATLSTTSPWVAAFLQRLRDLGWVEGRNIARRRGDRMSYVPTLPPTSRRPC
jgi:putative ABC transport system substrate-binding protein